MLMPKKTNYRKMMKGSMKGTETRGTEFEFGRYALKALEPGWITSRQIEAASCLLYTSLYRIASQKPKNPNWEIFLIILPDF